MSNTKKKSTAKKPAAKKLTKAQKEELERKKALHNEIKGVILVFVGIFVFFCIVNKNAGAIGTFISNITVKFFGSVGKYILAAVVLLSGTFLLFKKSREAAFSGVFGLNALICASFSTDNFHLYKFKEPQLYKDMWQIETNGGFIGSLLSKILKDLFSYGGAWLFIICITIVAFILIFRKSFVGTVKEEAERERELIETRRKDRLTQILEEEDRKKYIDLNKTKTVLETSDGDKLILVEAPKLKVRKSKSAEKLMSSGKDIHTDLPKLTMADDDYEENAAVSGGDVNVGTLDGSQSRITSRITNKESEKHGVAALGKLDDGKDKEEKKAKNVSNVKVEGDVSAPVTSVEDVYIFPPVSLLDTTKIRSNQTEKKEVYAEAAHLEKTLGDFGVDANVSEISIGPTITRFELQLQPGTRVSKIVSLQDDIALALAAQSVRMEAPIPGKSAVGIEIPNRNISTVKLSQVITAKEFTSHPSHLAAALGLTLSGEPLIMDISAMPHVLIAGATGSGKSVCINTIITSVLYHSSPADVKMILIDPKMVELNVYNEIPHLLIPVVTDAKLAAGALSWAVREMTSRYETFAENKVKDIDNYNKKIILTNGEKMPRIMLVIDELSDLMMVAKQQVEASICRLAQLARAAGIHIVLATQRPSVDVITGLIKANIPSRISFAVSSQIDSRTIIDTAGAEKLLGKGDMLYYPQSFDKPLRAQGAFISEEEIEKIVDFIKKKQTVEYDDGVMSDIKASASEVGSGSSGGAGALDGDLDDDLIVQAMEVAFEKGQISTSAIQRKLRLGYARAGRIIDEMEEKGYISEPDGARPRRVLVGRDEFYNSIGAKGE